MRLAIIGQQAFGKRVMEAFLARGDEVAGVFCAPEKPGAPADPLRLAAEDHGVALFQLPDLKSDRAHEALRARNTDLAVMAYVLQFAPQSFLSIPRHGTIQYHPSLLPHYRGPSSINWPIIKGDLQTGLTIFRPTDGLDEGPIVLQKTVSIGPDDTVGSIYFDHLFPMGVDAMLEAADRVVAGDNELAEQDETNASYESWCRDTEAEINWHAHVDQIHDLVRGCDPAPGAWTCISGRKLRLYHAEKHPDRRFADTGSPGGILAIGQDSIRIAARGGSLEVHKARIDDGDKRAAAGAARSLGLAEGVSLPSLADNSCLPEQPRLTPVQSTASNTAAG